GGAGRTGPLALGAAAFTGGAVLLSVEIAASRVLAPYFGNSLFVWGALIGVVLTGLSLGYWAGGALADRLPAATLLLGVIGLGALCVLAVPLVDEAVLEAIVSWDPGPRLNPLVAAVVLFGPVSIVLAAVTPVAVRLRMRSVAHAGRTAGRLFSVSTAGSIAGTFATAFFLIPEVGVEELFELGAATLLVAAVVVALLAREMLAVVVALALAAGAGYMAYAERSQAGERLTGAAARNWSPLYRTRGYGHLDARDARVGVEDGSLEVVFAEDTQYHRLAVVDDETTRYLRFDNSLQSAMYLDDPFRTRFRYTDYFHLGLAYNPDARNVLFIGLGAGSSPKRMWREFPDVRLHVVELDPVVVDVGYRYFSVPRDERLRVEVGDGRQFLARNERRWDVIVIDAFFADAIPFHLVTHEFLGLARERLAPGGVVVTNANGALAGPGSRLFRSIYRTYRTAFPTVLVHPAVEQSDRGAEAYRNLILVATEAAPPERDFLAERWAALRRRVPDAPELERPIRGRHDAPIPTDDVPTLTDDYAPTDALLLLFQ
ncbi:MAG: fused MFS/spermidine synthase, partial [Actinomycetota bacterium]|nr:fused MFS/spermidine synthase [Actinomycetota bacterium]